MKYNEIDKQILVLIKSGHNFINIFNQIPLDLDDNGIKEMIKKNISKKFFFLTFKNEILLLFFYSDINLNK